MSAKKKNSRTNVTPPRSRDNGGDCEFAVASAVHVFHQTLMFAARMAGNVRCPICAGQCQGGACRSAANADGADAGQN